MKIYTFAYDLSFKTSIRTKELYDELSRRGHLVHYAYMNKSIKLNGKFHKMRNPKYIPRIISYSIQSIIHFLMINKQEKFDLILTWAVLEGFLGAIMKVISHNTKLVLLIRGDTIAVTENSIKNHIRRLIYMKILKIFEKFAFKKADLIIFLSYHDMYKMINRTNSQIENKSIVIYNNINTQRIFRLGSEEPIKFNNKNVIGFVGQLGILKGLKYLIDAFKIIKNDIEDIILVIVGDGPDRREIIEYAKELGVYDSIQFVGYKKNPIKYMKGFDLMILPSLTEAFGYVLLESISVGTPVLGSNVGGIPEVLKYEYLMFEPKNSVVIAKKIKKLILNKEEYEKAKYYCNKRKENFNFDWANEMIKNIEDFN